MFARRLYIPIASIALVTLSTGTHYVVAQEGAVGIWPQVLPLKHVEPGEEDSEVRRLIKERYNETVSELRAEYQLFLGGRTTIRELTDTIEAFAGAGGELADTAVARVSELELALLTAKAVEAIAVRKHAEGIEPIQNMHHARACRLGIEIQLLRAREAAKAAREPK
jgi:hypothetical protein